MSADGAVAPSSGWTDVVAVALIAVVLAAAAAAWWFSAVVTGPVAGPDPAVDGRRLTTLYDPPARPVEEALNKGDGQLFAALATDPAVQRPEQVRGGPEEQAYRYQRMAYGWLGWAASGGQRQAVPWALVAVTAASVGLLVGAGGRMLQQRGAEPAFALLLAVQPAVFIDITWVGPEVLGTALALIGLATWARHSERAPGGGRASGSDGIDRAVIGAVLCFAAAGLCRETLLLVPAVIALHEAWKRRWHLAGAASLAAVPYVLWVLFLRVQIGAWPSGSVGGRLSPVPFGGLVAALPGWGPADLGVAALILVPAVAALALSGPGLVRTVVAADLAFASLLGQPVWNRWPDFSRVLLPLSSLAIVAVVAAIAERRARTAVRSGNLGTWSNVPLPAPSPMAPARTSSETPTAG